MSNERRGMRNPGSNVQNLDAESRTSYLVPRTSYLRAVYDELLAAYGPQGWWPARTAWEVVVGAILTQHTSWTNVARALARLEGAGALALDTMRTLPPPTLAE